MFLTRQTNENLTFLFERVIEPNVKKNAFFSQYEQEVNRQNVAMFAFNGSRKQRTMLSLLIKWA